MAPLGFKATAHGQGLWRRSGSFTEKLTFQSSYRNAAGRFIAIWPHASVHLKALKDWREQRSPGANWGDYVAATRVENLADGRPEGWDLADPARREEVLRTIVETIHTEVLPWFDLIEDADRLLAAAEARDVPGADIFHVTEYALFLGRPALATAIVEAWLVRSGDADTMLDDRGLGVLVDQHGLRVKMPDVARNRAKVGEIADRLRLAAGGPLGIK